MNERTIEYFKILHRQYMNEVKKFLKALKENAPRNELISIRTNVRKILAEIRQHPISNNANK